MEVMPADAVNLTNMDCAPPLDYKEPETQIQKVVDDRAEKQEPKMFVPFMGKAWRLDGIPVMAEIEGCSAMIEDLSKLVIDEEKKKEKDGGKEEEKIEQFKPFTGRSHVLGGIY